MHPGLLYHHRKTESSQSLIFSYVQLLHSLHGGTVTDGTFTIALIAFGRREREGLASSLYGGEIHRRDSLFLHMQFRSSLAIDLRFILRPITLVADGKDDFLILLRFQCNMYVDWLLTNHQRLYPDNLGEAQETFLFPCWISHGLSNGSTCHL